MRFLDDLKTMTLAYKKDEFYRVLNMQLDDPETKRILFDSRQAALFADLGEAPPAETQRRLVWPFRQFYLELTDPIKFGANVPTENSDSLLQAMPDYNERNNNLQAFLLLEGTSCTTPEGPLTLHGVVFFFNTGPGWAQDGALDCRGFFFHLPTGRVFTQRKTLVSLGVDVPTVPPAVPAQWGTWMVEISEELLEALPEGNAKKWCENVQLYGGFMSWCVTYMTAKGVRVVEERVSRQQRRLMARSKLPQPWHIVTVEPRISSAGRSEDEGRQHRYRYDVMGHLRFGRHKLADGSYRTTVEVVRPHQRGLANDRYIPKVSKFNRGKVVDPRVRQYLGNVSVA